MHKPYIKNKERYTGVRIDVQIYKYISTGLRWIAIENSPIPTLSINVRSEGDVRGKTTSLNLIPLSPRLTRRRFGFVSEGQFQAVGNSSRRDVVPSESTLTG